MTNCYDFSDLVHFLTKCCLKGLLKILKLMLILWQVRLSKGQDSVEGLVSRRVRAPQGQSPPQGLEKKFHPVGAIPMEPYLSCRYQISFNLANSLSICIYIKLFVCSSFLGFALMDEVIQLFHQYNLLPWFFQSPENSNTNGIRYPVTKIVRIYRLDPHFSF